MRVREEVTARMPVPDEVQGLVMPDGVPVLDVLRTILAMSYAVPTNQIECHRKS